MDYDTWKTSTPYDDIDYHNCRNCNDLEKNKERAQEALTSIVKRLYIDQKIDCAGLEDDIELLCRNLEVTLPCGIINLYRHDEKIKHFPETFSCDDLIEQNQNYLKLLVR